MAEVKQDGGPLAPYVGIDGCRAGWLAIALDDGDEWRYRVAGKLKPLLQGVESPTRVLIDMPLGLLGGAGSHRECDVQARELLGWPRAASVFTPPARPTLAASDYQEALLINRRCQGKGLSKQAWNLVPKIRELDKLRRKHGEWRGVVREAHPELCFWAINGGKAMAHNKATLEGRRERLRLLGRRLKNARHIVDGIAAQTLRKDVAWDDILDALVLAVSARFAVLTHLPAEPAEDRYGIGMEIVYPETT